MMQAKLKYFPEKLMISQHGWDRNCTAKTESMMALGNGYLGLRATDEEVAVFNKEDFFVNGIFNAEHNMEVSELANLADLTQMAIYFDGKLFALNSRDEYTKTLQINDGLLVRTITIRRGPKQFRLTFERFVSQDNKHFYGQKLTITQLKGVPTQLVVWPKINGQTTNQGAQHVTEGIKKRVAPTALQYMETTTNSHRLVIHNMVLNGWLGTKKIKPTGDDYLLTMARRQVGFKIKTMIDSKTPFVLEKMMSVNTSIDNDQTLADKQLVYNTANQLFTSLNQTNFMIEKQKSQLAWKRLGQQFFLEISGTTLQAKYDKLANAFAIFHMNSFVPKNNPNLSIGAKGLSGEGYQGHTFWDTELFILPNYLMIKPQIARNLLTYRYRGLAGARAKAAEIKERPAESQLQGAQYPWEMAWPTDGEVCPYWGQADIVSGEQIPIASRRQEIHVAADIAYATHQYFHFTNDKQFMNQMGYEMIFDTAWFYAQRAELQPDGSYSINDVMGPNEYKGNINNNAYINGMAKYNLMLACHYFDTLQTTPEGINIFQAVIAKIPYDIDFKQMAHLVKTLQQQIPNAAGIIAENDQFLSLPRYDISAFQLQGDAGKRLFNTTKGQKLLSGQIVKQADVVLLTTLLPNWFPPDIIAKNFDFYEQVTTHDSSLSPSTYALQAITLRKMDLANRLYNYSINIDMGPNMHSCDAGIHAGAMAAIWQSTVFGYGGLRWIDNQLHVDPILPAAWTKLTYRVQYQGAWLEVVVNHKSFTIRTTNHRSIDAIIGGKRVTVSDQPIKQEVRRD